MNRRLIMFVVVQMALVSSLLAAESAKEVLENVRKKYESVTDAQIKFSQKTTFEYSKIEQSAAGTLLMKKENKYRVEFPGQTVVTNGVTVWSYSEANNQVLMDKFKTDERSLTPEKILTGSPKDFYATIIGREKIGNKETIVLKLVPKDEMSFVKSMKLWVAEETWLISKAEVVDINGKQTAYMVNEIKVNIGISDARFSFQVPDGVEIVDLR